MQNIVEQLTGHLRSQGRSNRPAIDFARPPVKESTESFDRLLEREVSFERQPYQESGSIDSNRPQQQTAEQTYTAEERRPAETDPDSQISSKPAEEAKPSDVADSAKHSNESGEEDQLVAHDDASKSSRQKSEAADDDKEQPRSPQRKKPVLNKQGEGKGMISDPILREDGAVAEQKQKGREGLRAEKAGIDLPLKEQGIKTDGENLELSESEMAVVAAKLKEKLAAKDNVQTNGSAESQAVAAKALHLDKDSGAKKGKSQELREARKGEKRVSVAPEHATANVSRETPASANNIIIKNLGLESHFKQLGADAFAQQAQTSQTGSEANSGSQQFNLFSSQMNANAALDKMAANRGMDANAFRHQLQQQFDNILQRARVVVKDNENARLTAQLYPRELGKVSLKLALIDGQLHGKFLVENEMVQRELMDRLDRVVDDLRGDGLDVESFTVDIGPHGGGETLADGNSNFASADSNSSSNTHENDAELAATAREGIYA